MKTSWQRVAVDSHAHFYPCFSLARWIDAAVENLSAGNSECLPVVIVVDREGQDTAKTLADAARDLGCELTPTSNGLAVWLDRGPSTLLLLRGCQVISSEKIEVLGFGASHPEGPRAPAAEVVSRIRASGGTPCLPWSPGKWLFERGRVVRRILETSAPDSILFGDVPIRSVVPSLLLKNAERRHFAIVSGTDPLPFEADTERVGSFYDLLETPISKADDPFPAIMIGLRDRARTRYAAGSRNTPLVAVRRWIQSMR